ncbi:hypothetical protein BST21_13265 [Mycolicibacterium celeriflavum]|nr:hypothetical protein BST21_13265 [Mycolicibacterium celeriflavum]
MLDDSGPGAATLSAMIAGEVFKEQETVRSTVLAAILIDVLPECLPTAEARTLAAYRLRVIGQKIDGVSQQVGEVADDVREVGGGVTQANQTLTELRDLVIGREKGGQPDPDVLINGPLSALGLEEEYTAIRALEATDPRAAAARLTHVISRVETAGHANQTGPFKKQRAELLSRAGDPGAADAWLVVVDERLATGGIPALHEPLQAWRSLVVQGDSPSWLEARIASVTTLENWLLGDIDATNFIEQAVKADDAGDPAAIKWLVHAAEACLTDQCESSIVGVRDRLVTAADRSDDAALSVRLLLAVAEATADEDLWRRLLSAASPTGGRYEADVSALIHARRARSLFWSGRLADALTEYHNAYENAARALNWEDAAEWAKAAVHVMNAGDTIVLDELQALRDRESAFRAAGVGSMFPLSLANLHLSALAHLTESQANQRVRAARSSLRRYQNHSLLSGAITHEIDAHALTGRFWVQLGDADSAVGHFIIAGDLTQAASAAAELTVFHDCYEYLSSGLHRQRAVALRVAAEEADLIPDDQVARWAAIALTEARKKESTLFGPDTYVNSYKLIEGLASRFPVELVDELLAEIRQILPRPKHMYTTVDDQVAQILINLGGSGVGSREVVANCIAIAFEEADDIAVDIVSYARSLSNVLRPVRDRLLALVGDATPAPGQIMQLMNATMALVEIDDRSPALLSSADGFLSRALNRPPAYSKGSMARIAWVEEPAIIAKCLPINRRIELANEYVRRALDTKDMEANRASYAVAFVNLGPHLSNELRDSIFDQLLPLAGEPAQPTNFVDAMQQRFRNPLGRLRVSGDTGRLRRHALKALAVLATDVSRQQTVWRTAQKLIVSGQRTDSVAVASVGYELSKRGFAPELPWESMAYSADREMRQLAAALIPFLPTVDDEGVSNLAADADAHVRWELAIALKKLTERDDLERHERERIDGSISRLRDDPSYRVRSELPR